MYVHLHVSEVESATPLRGEVSPVLPILDWGLLEL